MSEKLCVVMPVYNEQDAIGPVLEKWAKALDALGVDYTIRPYNDGSKDNSLAVMKAAAEHLPHVDVRDKKNGGHGNTILTGYRDAAADGFDWVFQVDSDDEMGPEKFGELWAKRADYDFLVGIRDGRVQQLPRKIISFVSRMCVRMFYGKSVWDVNTPYRLMRVSAFKELYQAIPLKTFAPNVILSGLAARNGMRCYEIRVPQHDRTTGEVSIKKWKLLKAAMRSFFQTIAFSMRSASGSNGGCVGFLLAIAFSMFVLVTLNTSTFQWFDEIGTSDTAVNCVLHGEWRSHVWPYSYNPLHINLLIGWLWLFGVSHFSVCAFTVLCSFATCVLLQRSLIRVGILKDWLMNALYQVAFWFGSWEFSYITTNGRIDMLVALLTLALVLELMPQTARHASICHVFVRALLLMLAGVYSVPVIVFFGMFLLVTANTKTEAALILKKGLIAAAGVTLGFALSCLYHGFHQHFFRFVHSYFSYNGTLSQVPISFVDRVLQGYCAEVTGAFFWIMALLVLLVSRSVREGGAWRYLMFVALIPLLGVVGGRYESYYSWLFYLPALTCLLFAISRLKSRMLLTTCCAVLLLGNGVFRWFEFNERWKSQVETIESVGTYVEAHPEIFRSGQKIAILDTWLYYPVVRSGAEIWKMGDGSYQDISPREKCQNFLNKWIKDEKSREVLLRIFDRYEKSPEKLEAPYYSCKLQGKKMVVNYVER